MSTLTSTTASTTTDCPSWCVEHIRPEDAPGGVIWGGTTTLHMGADVEGETTEGRWVVGKSVDGPDPATLDAAADGQMTTAQARAFAAAIVAACDLLEGDRVAARVARRVAAIVTAEPLYPDRIEALAAALGVEWPELVMNNPEAVRS